MRNKSIKFVLSPFFAITSSLNVTVCSLLTFADRSMESIPAIHLTSNNLEERWMSVVGRVYTHFLHFLPTNHNCADQAGYNLIASGGHPAEQLVLFTPDIREKVYILVQQIPEIEFGDYLGACLIRGNLNV